MACMIRGPRSRAGFRAYPVGPPRETPSQNKGSDCFANCKCPPDIARSLISRLTLKYFAFLFSSSGTNSTLDYSYPPNKPRCRIFRIGLKTSTGRCSLSCFLARVKIVTPLTILIIRSYDSCYGGLGCFVVAVNDNFDNAFGIFFWAWNQRQAEWTNFKSKIVENCLNWCRTWI